MRTTLDIADDVLVIAKTIARHQKISVGKALTDLARRGVQPAAHPWAPLRNGLRILPRSATATPVTLDMVNHLREES